MNPSKCRMLKEHPNHYEMHDGTAPFRVPKKGLSEELHGRIRKMADGGTVLSVDDLAPTTPEQIAAALEGATYGTPAQPPQYGGADAGMALQSRPVPNAEVQQRSDFEANSKRLIDETKRRDALVTEGNHVQPAPPPLRSLSLADSHPQQAAPAPAPAQPPPAPTRPVGGGAPPAVTPGSLEESDAARQKQAALDAQYGAEAQLARGKAAALGAQQAQLEHDAIEQRQRAETADRAGKDALAKVQAATDDMKSVDTTIEPGRMWASASTGQRIAGVIGLVLGSLGAGPDGINRAAGMLNQAIDRDIDAQKAEHTFRMQKGKAAIESATSMYGLHRQQFQDDETAHAAAQATARALAINKIEQVEASVADPMAKAKLEALKAGVVADLAKNKEEVYFKQRDASTKQQIADADTMRARAAMGKAGAGAKPAKNAAMVQGTVEAARAYQRELEDNPASPYLGELRASVERHLSKLQGGRANEYTQANNEAIMPGTSGASLGARAKALIFPGMLKRDFDILVKHIATTGDMPPNEVNDSGDE